MLVPGRRSRWQLGCCLCAGLAGFDLGQSREDGYFETGEAGYHRSVPVPFLINFVFDLAAHRASADVARAATSAGPQLQAARSMQLYVCPPLHQAMN